MTATTKASEKPESAPQPRGRVLDGVVVKRSGDKTVSVEVTRVLLHPIYQKRQKRTKRYLAHDASNSIEVGQAVQIKETRPLSARKRWVVVT